ncbi:PTS lactose/cellobiose transporter subunit IIA [Fusibacter ferrireducens]|uniref:PTS lactose/cellobiose transporter subunit IIA n=1 Tax=Fusibacter ferrireducens TaxID=2785058 RepID=A0ABR9ZYX5_9FIRM|nr:PTS lactose/cellobiose transporter subunit IIA [Fusibacter ferrireducens]MBF4695668.1 PTS lactose/cellobiose transporter subunit IIA [Fusibacter ferrireducens]
MEMTMERIIMELIVNAGNARSLAMEAIGSAKTGDFVKAEEQLKTSEEWLNKAHVFQTELIQAEAAGTKTELSILLVHGQDHFMNAMTVQNLAKEFVSLYCRLEDK